MHKCTQALTYAITCARTHTHTYIYVTHADPLIYAGFSDFFQEINESSIFGEVCVFVASNVPLGPPLEFLIETVFFFNGNVQHESINVYIMKA